MTNELQVFYGAALTAGSILSGFFGTFLSFRIQREASYYRQPALDFNSRRAKDIFVDLSRFPVSLALLLLSMFCSTVWGVVLPLVALAGLELPILWPPNVLAGIIASIVLVAGYFYLEMFHYGMLRRNGAEWGREIPRALGMIAFALLAAYLTYHFAQQ